MNRGFTPHHFLRKKFNQTRTTKSGAGFTLVELLVVIAIISFISALILPNYQEGQKQFALQRSAHKLAQDLRRVQEMAMSSKEFPGAPGTFEGGYGIYFNISQPNQYILFADLDNDRIFDSGEEVKTSKLEKKVIISNLFPPSPLTVIFIPPDPQVFISGGNEATITLSLETDLTKTKFVIVNKAGLIRIAEQAGDQCNLNADCDDGNLCTNDWCERPTDPDSVCHNDSLLDGTDCGDCQECQLGVCTFLCQGIESSCECIIDLCRDCSNYYGTACDYGTCSFTERPSWTGCSGTSCLYSCNYDPGCGQGYAYRKQITIQGSTAGAQTNYQMKLIVHKGVGTDSGNNVYLNNHVQDDFDDIRFTKLDGVTKLDYWTEATSTATSTLWIEFDSIPASPSSANFYIYYGNQNVASNSNIKTTFIVGDDFDDGSLDTSTWGWIRENPGKWDEGTTQSGWLMMKVVQNEDMDQFTQNAAILKTNTAVSGDYEAIVRIQISPTASWQQACLFTYQDDSNWLKSNRIYGFAQRSEFNKYVGGGFSWGLVANTLTDFYLKIRKVGTTYTAYYSSDQSSWTQIFQYTAISITDYIALSSFSGSAAAEINSFYDNFMVRKYISPEPTWGIWGSEES